MRNTSKDNISIRAKVCTILSGLLVISVLAFAVYARSRGCKIPNIKNPAWGVLVMVVCLIAIWILIWGWKTMGDSSKETVPTREKVCHVLGWSLVVLTTALMYYVNYSTRCMIPTSRNAKRVYVFGYVLSAWLINWHGKRKTK